MNVVVDICKLSIVTDRTKLIDSEEKKKLETPHTQGWYNLSRSIVYHEGRIAAASEIMQEVLQHEYNIQRG